MATHDAARGFIVDRLAPLYEEARRVELAKLDARRAKLTKASTAELVWSEDVVIYPSSPLFALLAPWAAKLMDFPVARVQHVTLSPRYYETLNEPPHAWLLHISLDHNGPYCGSERDVYVDELADALRLPAS